MNKLLTNLGKEAIGDLGITLNQEHIIGAYPIEQSSNNDKPPITRLTVDSRETKEKIQKASEIARRWGSAGGHTVFLRDILPEKQPKKERERPPMRTPKRPRKPKPMWKRPQGPPEPKERKVPPEDV